MRDGCFTNKISHDKSTKRTIVASNVFLTLKRAFILDNLLAAAYYRD